MLREQIKEVLLERIIDGAYPPGERIVETRIAQEFGVSQAPVREALRELESMRFIVSEPFRGARVREVTTEELAEIYPVRAALEEVAARAAVSNMEGRVDALMTEIELMREAADARDVHRFIAHDVAFHGTIVDASGNRTLQELWTSLHIASRTTVTLIHHVDELGFVAGTHEPVLEALVSGDADLAGRTLRNHIEFFAAWAPQR